MPVSKAKRSLILRFFIFILLFALASCGTRVTIQFPDAPTDSPTLTASPLPSATASPSGVFLDTLVNLNLRSGAGTGFNVITLLPVGTRAQIIGKNSDSTWLYVTVGQTTGWVSANSSFSRITGNLATVPVVGSPIPPTSSPEPTPTRETGFRISYNVNGNAVPNIPYLLEHLYRLCPTSVLIMDNLALADEIYQNTRHCETIVIHRSWSSAEGDEWQRRTVSSWISQWQGEGYPHLVRYDTNEPSYSSGNIQAYVNYQVELMRQARQAGFTVAVGNHGVGTIRASDMAAGRYDPILRALNQYGHYLALHEYTSVVLPFGVGLWSRESLLDRNLVQPDRWASAAQLPTSFVDFTASSFTAQSIDALPFGLEMMFLEEGFAAQSVEGMYPPYWHLRRGDWWLLRADEIGVARPRIVLTEFAWDNLADINPTLQVLRDRFGIDKYFRDMRGVNTYQRVWEWYYPQWSFGQAACEQLKWADAIYPEEYIGFNMFTWTNHPHWLHTDMSGAENPSQYELHRCLENYASSFN